MPAPAVICEAIESDGPRPIRLCREEVRLARVTELCFSPDGKWLVTAGQDGQTYVWLWQPQDIIAEACSRLSRSLLTHQLAAALR